jgi:hypothetical protein
MSARVHSKSGDICGDLMGCAVIPGRAKREPGIHFAIAIVARWIL